MCLNIVTSTTRDRKREGFGWKVFTVRSGILSYEYFGGAISEEIWLKSKDNGAVDYPLGFHLFRTRKAARKWKSSIQRVRKAKFKDVLAEGFLSYYDKLPVIVAKEMFILET